MQVYVNYLPLFISFRLGLFIGVNNVLSLSWKNYFDSISNILLILADLNFVILDMKVYKDMDAMIFVTAIEL